MVQRFIEGGYGTSEMEEDAQGEWVAYEDYESLVKAVENYIDGMTHEFDSEYSLCADPRIALAKLLGRSLGDMQ